MCLYRPKPWFVQCCWSAQVEWKHENQPIIRAPPPIFLHCLPVFLRKKGISMSAAFKTPNHSLLNYAPFFLLLSFLVMEIIKIYKDFTAIKVQDISPSWKFIFLSRKNRERKKYYSHKRTTLMFWFGAMIKDCMGGPITLLTLWSNLLSLTLKILISLLI